MTSLVVERFDTPGSARDIRAFGAADERSADVLGGRTVWCTAGEPAAGAATRELRACLGGAGRALTAAALPLQEPDERLRILAQQIDEMLTGHDAGRPGLGRRDGRIYSKGATESERLIGDGVCPRDVVVAHDVLSAVLCEAARDRGAHAVRRVRIARRWINPARQALDRLAWRMALAEVVRSDRDEAVGGTLHPRPTVAAR